MRRSKKYFIYEIICSHPDYLDMKYIGSHYGYLDDSYKGSGVMLRRVRKSIGDIWFTRSILEIVEDEKDLIPTENRYLREVDAKSNPQYFNLTNDSADWSLRRSHKGLIWAYHPDTKEQRFFKETSVPEGWIRGLYGTKGKTSYWKGKSLPKKIIAKLSNEWEVTHPSGIKEIITNMHQFCRTYNLNPSTMSAVARGKRRHHKGYSCKITTNKKNNGYVYKPFESSRDNSIFSRPGKLNHMAKPVTYKGKNYECMTHAMEDLGVYYYKLKQLLQEDSELNEQN